MSSGWPLSTCAGFGRRAVGHVTAEYPVGSASPRPPTASLVSLSEERRRFHTKSAQKRNFLAETVGIYSKRAEFFSETAQNFHGFVQVQLLSRLSQLVWVLTTEG